MIKTDLIIPGLPATSKKQAFRLMAEAYAQQFGGKPEDLLNALLDREKIGSTGIGNGVAIPHVKFTRTDRMHAILARLEKPVDYDAVDGQPVDIIFLLLAPVESKTTQHLKTLAHIAKFLKDAKNQTAIRATADKIKLAAILDDWAKSLAA